MCSPPACARLGRRLDLYNLPTLYFLATVFKRPDLGRAVIYCDHEELLTALRFLRVDSLISTYPNDRYA